MRHSPHYRREPLPSNNRADHRSLAYAADDDVDDDYDDDDGIPSADEDDDEEEMLIASPIVYARDLAWTRREFAWAAALIVLWCASSTCITFGPHVAHPFAAAAAFALVSWALARTLLLLLRVPVLVFGDGWRPYLSSVAFAGIVGGLECGMSLWAITHCTPALVTLGRAAAPPLQLLVALNAGLQRRRGDLLAAVGFLGLGLALTSYDESETSHAPPLLALLGCTALGTVRGRILQSLLHGRDVHPQLLVPRRTIATPLQLMCALAPWACAACVLVALLMESSDLAAGVPSSSSSSSSSAASHARGVEMHSPPPPITTRRAAAAASLAAVRAAAGVAPSYIELALLALIAVGAGLLSLHVIGATSALTFSVASSDHAAAVQQLVAYAAAAARAHAGVAAAAPIVGAPILATLPSPSHLTGIVLTVVSTIAYAQLTIRSTGPAASSASGRPPASSFERSESSESLLGSPNHGHGPPAYRLGGSGHANGGGGRDGADGVVQQDATRGETWSIQRPPGWRGRGSAQAEDGLGRSHGSRDRL